ncbi:MAG: PEP-CTERM sorting domain-containing protein [Phycisphaerales bacterium]|nr:PEP-CTERM sorting domain-containing protein [Phycisphaerales bacterium]
MKKVLGLIAVAGLATAAVARPAPNLSLEFSTNGGGTWSSDVAVAPGTSVWVQVVMSIPDDMYGISGARYNITSTNAAGWDSAGADSVDLSTAKGSATDGRLAGFDFGGQTQQVFEALNSLRIDAKGDNNNTPNAGISTSQNTPGALGSNFNTAKVAAVYRFQINTSATHALTDSIVLQIMDGGANGSPNQITSFKGYTSSASTSGTDITGATGDTGRITFIPAPASLALVGLAGLAAGRRRR